MTHRISCFQDTLYTSTWHDCYMIWLENDPSVVNSLLFTPQVSVTMTYPQGHFKGDRFNITWLHDATFFTVSIKTQKAIIIYRVTLFQNNSVNLSKHFFIFLFQNESECPWSSVHFKYSPEAFSLRIFFQIINCPGAKISKKHPEL